MNFINGHILLDQLFLKHAKKKLVFQQSNFSPFPLPLCRQFYPLLRAVDLTLNSFLTE